MSLRLLQKQVGMAPSETSTEAKATTQTHGRNNATGGGSGRQGGSGGGRYQRGGDGGSYPSSGGYGANMNDSRGGGYYSKNDSGWDDGATGAVGHRGGNSTVAAPKPAGGFHGSDVQRAHVQAMQAANKKEAAASTHTPASEVAVRSHLGLDALKEKKRAEEEQKQAKREAARARRHNEATQKEADDEQAIAECEEQAWRDSEQNERLKYEAALIVRIAVKFGTAGVWMKIAEARARGADIPLDPRRIYLLAHPDKCPLEEASDATAILNAQRPPEMTEALPRAKPKAKASSPATPANVAPVDADQTAQEANKSEFAGANDQRYPANVTESTDSAIPADMAAGANEEKRVDPEDNQVCTLYELQQKYAGIYPPEEIEDYWKNECTFQPRFSKTATRW